MRRSAMDYSGKRVGMCVVIGMVPRNPTQKSRMWSLRCDCGAVCEKPEAVLKQDRPTTRCDVCFARSVSEANRTHGATGTPLFRAWCNMKNRCYREDYAGASNYSGRGITVFAEWKDDFLAFATYIRKHLGERPSAKYSLDRIDNDGHYEPGNVRWATAKTQRANQRRTSPMGDEERRRKDRERQHAKYWENRVPAKRGRPAKTPTPQRDPLI